MGQSITLQNARVNWPQVLTPRASKKFPNNPPQYSLNIMPSPADVKKIQQAMDSEAQTFKGKKYDEPPSWEPKEDGSVELRVSAPATRKPPVVDQNMEAVIDESQIYSGCYCNVAIDIYASDTYGNKISVGLLAVQKSADGERMDNAPQAEDLFKPIPVSGNNPGPLD